MDLELSYADGGFCILTGRHPSLAVSGLWRWSIPKTSRFSFVKHIPFYIYIWDRDSGWQEKKSAAWLWAGFWGPDTAKENPRPHVQPGE